jgi:hypothetical protein
VSSNVARRRWWLAVRLTAAALVWSAGLVLAALLVPAYNGTVSGVDGLSLTTRTLAQVHGAWILLPVALPAAISVLVGLALRRRYRGSSGPSITAAWVSIILLGVLAAISILSIGAFVIPVVILLVLALRLTPDRREQRGRRRPPRAEAEAHR